MEHRRREWRRTSAEYYEDLRGKKKKSEHNQRQRDRKKASAAPETLPGRLPEESKKEIPSTLVSYVQRVVSAIEGRRVSREEILEMLAKEKSQHSIVRERRVDQIIRSLHERPP